MRTYASSFSSPLGEILLLGTELGLMGVWFCGQRHFPQADPDWNWDEARLTSATKALGEYFAGGSEMVLPSLDLRGTAFQQRVWRELLKIPAGETCSYADIARSIGNPKAVRAVGRAIGRNPVSILVPCHRVVGSGGALTGYAGGVERKAWLLAHEGGGSRDPELAFFPDGAKKAQ